MLQLLGESLGLFSAVLASFLRITKAGNTVDTVLMLKCTGHHKQIKQRKRPHLNRKPTAAHMSVLRLRRSCFMRHQLTSGEAGVMLGIKRSTSHRLNSSFLLNFPNKMNWWWSICQFQSLSYESITIFYNSSTLFLYPLYPILGCDRGKEAVHILNRSLVLHKADTNDTRTLS